MDKVKILIVEDEALIAESLQDTLEGLGYEVIGMAMRAKEALDIIAKETPDLAILDINLKGEEDGIWLAEQIQKTYDFPYIFLTSFGNKSTVDRAVKTKPYGYLIKPFKKVDIFSAIEVALHNYANRLQNTPEKEPDKQENIVLKDSMFVKEGYLFKKLVFNDILYLKADDNYLHIHTPGKRTVIKSAMKDLLPQLPADSFMQTHRSWAVNITRIDSLGASFVNVGDIEIPVGNTYKEELFGKLGVNK